MHSIWSGRVISIPTIGDKLKIMACHSTMTDNFPNINRVSREWYCYLKKNHLYKTYVSRIYEMIHNGYGGGMFDATSYTNIERICKHIDEHVSGNCTHRWWQDRYSDFKGKIDAPLNHHKNCAKLYRVNAPKIQHSKYIGSSELRKSLYDRAIDGFFKLFTK